MGGVIANITAVSILLGLASGCADLIPSPSRSKNDLMFLTAEEKTILSQGLRFPTNKKIAINIAKRADRSDCDPGPMRFMLSVCDQFATTAAYMFANQGDHIEAYKYKKKNESKLDIIGIDSSTSLNAKYLRYIIYSAIGDPSSKSYVYEGYFALMREPALLSGMRLNFPIRPLKIENFASDVGSEHGVEAAKKASMFVEKIHYPLTNEIDKILSHQDESERYPKIIVLYEQAINAVNRLQLGFPYIEFLRKEKDKYRETYEYLLKQ